MTFPTIPTVAAGRVLTALATNPAGTHTSPDLSSLTKNAGDLLIAIVIIYDGNSSNAEFSAWGGGFTEFKDQAGTATMAIGLAYKWSTGSETGTFTVTSADTSANDSAFILLSIPGAHASTPPEAGNMATGTAPDSDSLAPSWGAEDNLWITVGASGENSTSGTYTGIGTAPTNYGNQADSGISADAIGGVEGSVAFRQLNAASEDPGAWSMDTSNARGAALVIAVRPAAAATTLTPDPATIPIGVPDPTLAQGPLTLTPSPAAIPISATSPTLVLAYTLTPSPAQVPIVAPDPTILKPLTLTPAAAAVVLAVPDPVLLVDRVLFPSPAVVTLDAPSPAVSLVLTLAPSPAVVPVVAPSPAVSLVLTLTPSPAEAAVAAPTVTVAHVYTLTPGPAAVPVLAPVVTLQTPLALTPAPAVAQVAVPAVTMTVEGGAITLVPNPVTIPVAVPTPTLALGPLVLTPTPAQVVLVAPASAISLVLGLTPAAVAIPILVPPFTVTGGLDLQGVVRGAVTQPGVLVAVTEGWHGRAATPVQQGAGADRHDATVDQPGYDTEAEA